jgi:D-aspartate ligase
MVEALVRAARRLAAQHGVRPPLFYDNDDRLALVQDYRAALAPHFALLLNDPELDAALLDKERFQELGERRGLPVPRRVEWDALALERGPVLVKPKVKTGWDHSPVHRQLFGGAGKARTFECGRAARENAPVQRLAAQLAFQEYVPGDDTRLWTFHGFAAPGGKVLDCFLGRKIRTYPEGTGDSAYLRLARDEGLAARGREIAARLGLAGIFKMDFKRGPDGRDHLLEINTRFNLWNYLGAANGVNLPRVAYEYLTTGATQGSSRQGTRTRWLALRYDWRAYRELKANRRISAFEWIWSLLQAPKVYELFSWSDPAPFLHAWRGRFQRRWLRLWHSTAS